MAIALVSRTMFASKLKAYSGGKFLLLNATLNYAAAGTAGLLNCALMRYKETKAGIDITNKKGDVTYGKSREAGKKAVMQTGLSRAFLPVIPLCLPGITVAVLMHVKLYPNNNAA